MSVDALLNAYAAKNTDNRAHPIAAPYVPRWQDKYAIPDWQTRLTRLSPEEEMAFMEWAKKNRVPITPDYDMRGFWKAKGVSSVNQNDGLLHYPDTYKTPLHQSFSGESIFARKGAAPMWNERDQLVAPDGTVLYDERARRR